MPKIINFGCSSSGSSSNSRISIGCECDEGSEWLWWVFDGIFEDLLGSSMSKINATDISQSDQIK